MKYFKQNTTIGTEGHKSSSARRLSDHWLHVLAYWTFNKRMNTPKIEENIHTLDGGDFILWESPDNPFARIACKTRRLAPTICDGTCLNCKREREQFLRTEPQKLMTRDILTAWWDPDYEHLSLNEYAIRVQWRTQKLESIKKGIIEQRKSNHTLEERVNERMRTLKLRAQSPEPSPTLR